jgi:hypothetical protein
MKNMKIILPLFLASLSAYAQTASPQLYIGMGGGASQATGAYSVLNPENYAGGAKPGFSGSINAGGHLAEGLEWLACLNYSEHGLSPEAAYNTQKDIKSLKIEGYYATKGVGAGLAYFLPISPKKPSGFTIGATLQYFSTTLPSINIAIVPSLFESNTFERVAGTGGGLGYSASIGYRQLLPHSKVFVFATARYSAAELNANNIVVIKTYPRERPEVTSVSFVQNYTTADLHLGIGYFLK